MNESLAKRDSFFHSCWLELKHRRPDLFELTSQIELYIGGYTRTDESYSESDDEPTYVL